MRKFFNFFTGIGLFLVGIAVIIYVLGVSFRSNAELTSGTVSGFSTVTDSDDGSLTYCPMVKFTTNIGQQVTYDSHVCNSLPAHEVGDQVQIYYDPENPQSAQIKDFWSQYLVVTILACIGLPFVVFGSRVQVVSSNE